MKPAASTTTAPDPTQSLPVQNDASQYMSMGVPQLGIPQPWDVETLLQGQAVTAYPQVQPRLPVLTIYMQDYRTGDGENPDHLLAELPVPMQKDANEQWWVNADDVVRRLQGTPGRIDGVAKLSIKRGIYRQLFCRLSPESIEKCSPENLRVTGEHSIEIVIEPSTAPPPALPTPPNGSAKRVQEDDEEAPSSPSASSRNKRRKQPQATTEDDDQMATSPLTLTNGFGTNPNTLFIKAGSQVPSLSPLRTTKLGPTAPGDQSISDAKAADLRRNAKNELAKSVIIPWLRGKIEREEGYESFAKSKGRILTIHEALKGYRFARTMIQKYNNMQTPQDLDGAQNRKITKVNIWQALDRQTSWGSDAETTLALVEKYGPGTPEEHPKIVEMLNGKWGPDEREGAVLFLNHLKRIDSEHKANREAAAAAALAVVHGASSMS